MYPGHALGDCRNEHGHVSVDMDHGGYGAGHILVLGIIWGVLYSTVPCFSASKEKKARVDSGVPLLFLVLRSVLVFNVVGTT